jgi:glycosyltransferase involved in cell wall biosynthesis
MITILLSSNTAWSLYNFRAGLIHALLGKGYRVVALASQDDFSVKLAAIGCEVFNIDIDRRGKNPLNDLATFFAFWIRYRQIKPDIVLHFTIKPVIFGSLAARLLRIPCINMITGLGTTFISESFVTKLIKFLYRFSQLWPYKILFQNQDDLQLFLNHKLVNKERTMQVPGSGVDLSFFTAQPASRRKQTVFILFARLIWDKGIGIYVDAARQIKRFHPETIFQLLGAFGVENKTTISRAQVEEWVNEGAIEYLGETDDVRSFIANSDCVVLPSYYREGVPHSLLEAAAMARPIITTDNVGCREAVDDEVTGFLCKMKDADDLAEKMQKFIALSVKDRAAMGKSGRKKMENQFDEKIVISTYMDLINQIINGD